MSDVIGRYRDQLMQNEALQADGLWLALDGCAIAVRSNSALLLQNLARYFGHLASWCAADQRADIEVVAVERSAPELDVDYADWRREASKRGRKDTYIDIAEGRLLRKVRTGMVFLQSEAVRLAAGPCLANDNQVINFINAQYMNWLQQRDWLICHAAGVVCQGRGLAVAGFSGGGKSTLMLHLMEQPGAIYLTNDRLFVRHSGDGVKAAGVPKLPRVNPGTIVHNPRLHGLIDAQRRKALLTLPQQELWDLEEKYDVMIDDVYGPDRISQLAPLDHLLILNWSRTSGEPVAIRQVDLDQRRDLLPAIMKSPGPFYQRRDGSFHQDCVQPDPDAYVDALAGVTVHEVVGGVDFAGLAERCRRELLAS